MKRIFGLTHCLLVSMQILAQDNQFDLEKFMENRFQVQDDDLNYEELYETLLLHYTNPIDLNRTGREEFEALQILSPLQLTDFFNYRETYGDLISIYELQAIPSFDTTIINQLLPFVTLQERSDPRPLMERILTEENNYLLLRYGRTLEKSKGYLREDGNGFQGDPGSLYGRYRVSHPRDFSIGFTFEKDAGESLLFNPKDQQFGFDYYSGHLFLEDKGRFRAIVLGDYQLQFGQGLVFGSGFGAGKGAEPVTTVKKSSTGIRPYSSVVESGFFRGAAATMAFDQLEITLLASRLNQDARLLSDSTYSDFDEYVNSIQNTGLHRTPTERTGKNTLSELSTGYAITYTPTRSLVIGSAGLFSHFSSPINKKANNYNQYEFRGDQNFTGSIFADYNWHNLMLFGEAARSCSGGYGFVGGLLASLNPVLDFSWVLRNYEKSFHSFYSNAFGEGSRNINEKGMYWGLKYHPSRKYTFALYFDRFSFPWLKYRTNAPSDGYEYLSRFTWKPKRNLEFYLQFRQENKQISSSEENANLSQLVPTQKQNYLVNLDYRINEVVGVKTRIQGSRYREGSAESLGFAIMQDIYLTYKGFKLSTRFALFDTEDYENRQYAYERDVLYAFNLPAYSGTGTRNYLLLQYNASRNLSLWARFARTHYEDVTAIGSGNNEIIGNRRSEVKMMLRYRFRTNQ